MKGISLTQPWASLVAIGAKTVETRSWQTPYRGLLAIHAAKSFPPAARSLCRDLPFERALLEESCYGRSINHWYHLPAVDPDKLPRGMIVAVGELVLCLPTAQVVIESDNRGPNFNGFALYISEAEGWFGDYTAGRYAWVLGNVRRLEDPIPYRGTLGLWTLPEEVEQQVNEQLEAED